MREACALTISATILRSLVMRHRLLFELVFDLEQKILRDDLETVAHFFNVALAHRWIDRSGRL